MAPVGGGGGGGGNIKVVVRVRPFNGRGKLYVSEKKMWRFHWKFLNTLL
jgi:hypothetical protein